MLMKKCCTCKLIKSSDNFNKNKNNKDGLHARCIECRKKERLKYKSNEKDRNKNYYLKNKDDLLTKNKQYRINNEEKINIQRKDYRLKNSEHISNKNKEYLPIRKLKIKEKRKTDSKFQLSEILRSKYHKMIKGVNTSYTEIIGCDIQYLRDWLEFQFDKNMNWENLGKYWEIDHILPINKFKFDSEKDKYICYNWTNLQPLYKKTNRIKSDNLELHYYFNSIINVHRFSQKKLTNGYQKINESLSWLRLNSGMVKIP